MAKIQILTSTTRPNRVSKDVADWVYNTLLKRDDIEAELVDIAEYNLPVFDEPHPPLMDQYTNDHTKAWAAKISEADGYIFVTGEYNHSMPGALKNAIDYLNKEWNNKAVGFVSYGSAGGARAVEQLRLVAGELRMADVREQVLFYLGTDFENYSTLKATKEHEIQLNKVANQVIEWSNALKPLR